MGSVAPRIVAGCEAPGVFAVAFVMSGIVDTPGAINQGNVAIIVEVVGVTVGQGVRIESHVGIVSKEEGPTASDANVQLDSGILVFVVVVAAILSTTPTFAVAYGFFRLPGPSGVVKVGWHGVRRRGNSEQINDHHLVESGKSM